MAGLLFQRVHFLTCLAHGFECVRELHFGACERRIRGRGELVPPRQPGRIAVDDVGARRDDGCVLLDLVEIIVDVAHGFTPPRCGRSKPRPAAAIRSSCALTPCNTVEWSRFIRRPISEDEQPSSRRSRNIASCRARTILSVRSIDRIASKVVPYSRATCSTRER